MLRGVAALIVVYFHWGEMFWRSNEVAAQISFSTPLQPGTWLPHLNLTNWLYDVQFSFGSFGVALFFVVSGFVIPISLEKLGSKAFLVRRLFRLYPTYLVGLAVTYLVLYWSAQINDKSFPFTLADYLKNASMFRDVFDAPTIDNINWTLENEVKFYLLCAFLARISSLSRGRTIVLTVTALSGLAFVIGPLAARLSSSGIADLYPLATPIRAAAPFVCFMFFGTAFYNLYCRRWTMTVFLGVSFVLAGAFAFNVGTIFAVHSPVSFYVSYGAALACFGFFYRVRDRLPEPRCLSFAANISYPLYILHGVSGYALISFLYPLQPYPYLVLLEVFVLVLAASYALHRFVEVPSNRLGYALVKPVDTSPLQPRPSGVPPNPA